MIRLASTSVDSFESTFTYTEPGSGATAGPFTINHNKGMIPSVVRVLINLPSQPGVWTYRPNYHLFNGLGAGDQYLHDLNTVTLFIGAFHMDGQLRNCKVTCYF